MVKRLTLAMSSYVVKGQILSAWSGISTSGTNLQEHVEPEQNCPSRLTHGRVLLLFPKDLAAWSNRA